MFGKARTPRGGPQQLKSLRFPAPTRGINTKTATTTGDPDFCLTNYNLMPFDFGLQLRYGHRDYQTDVDMGLGTAISVNTIIPYEGTPSDATDDRLFAVTNEGIWDVSTDGGTPTQEIVFTDQTLNAGYGHYVHYTDAAGTTFIYYADSKNGLFIYDPTTTTWAQATGITGPTITNINFVLVHKQRMWLIEEDSSHAWYLPVGSGLGAGTQFDFGSKFANGGNLVGLYNWSVDGGSGVDDYLVAISRAGDVLPYQGEDPSSATSWNLRGSYYVGSLPKGNKIATEHGDDLYILSVQGIVALSDLLRGVNTAVIQSTADQASAVTQIVGILRVVMGSLKDQFGWEIKSIPSLAGIVIASPPQAEGDAVQFYFNHGVRGWCMWHDLPIHCLEEFNNSVMFGTKDMRVCRMDTHRDMGNPVRFSLVSTWLNLGDTPHFKHVQSVRGDFISYGTVQAHYTIRYDYDLKEAEPIQFGPVTPFGSVFDFGNWDVDRWIQTNVSGIDVLEGTWGRGRRFAVAMLGQSDALLNFVGWDVTYKNGGIY